MKELDSIVLGGGCFWCLEAAYQQLEGVKTVVPGYTGGKKSDATYTAVCTGQTGHVEVVKVLFDTSELSPQDVLAVFWLIHDPTSLNRQGADAGSQYASAIFYADDEQRLASEASCEDAQKQLNDPILTRIEPLATFYEAEPYHHNYFQNNPLAGYCQVVIEPKLSKLRQHFSSLLKV